MYQYFIELSNFVIHFELNHLAHNMNLTLKLMVYLDYQRKVTVHFIDFFQNFMYFALFEPFEMDPFVVERCE